MFWRVRQCRARGAAVQHFESLLRFSPQRFYWGAHLPYLFTQGHDNSLSPSFSPNTDVCTFSSSHAYALPSPSCVLPVSDSAVVVAGHLPMPLVTAAALGPSSCSSSLSNPRLRRYNPNSARSMQCEVICDGFMFLVVLWTSRREIWWTNLINMLIY